MGWLESNDGFRNKNEKMVTENHEILGRKYKKKTFQLHYYADFEPTPDDCDPISSLREKNLKTTEFPKKFKDKIFHNRIVKRITWDMPRSFQI